MVDIEPVAAHYTRGNLLDSIVEGLAKLGKTQHDVSVEDLAPIDEFHIGGREATQAVLDQLGLAAAHEVLDVGCGLGGAGRFAAQRFGCRIHGIDLTPEYVETGKVLCSWVGLADRVRLERGDATAIRYGDGTFDRAYMLHVGMNVAEKTILAAELFRVLRPGGLLGIYDVMRVGDGALTYPVPWAADPDRCAVSSVDDYRAALHAAGFQVLAERNRRDFALEFFARLRAAAAGAQGPPPLGIHLLMGETAPTKIENMVQNVSENRIAPIELIAARPV